MIVERLVDYLKHKGIAISAFERDLGLGNTTLSKAYKTGGSIGTDKLEKILSYCTDLSPLWLVTGQGGMLLNQDTKQARIAPTSGPLIQNVFVTNFADLKDVMVEAIRESRV